jgi:hypothetical protein
MISEASKMKQALALYNIIPNLFWSVINLVPITVFVYQYIEPKWVCMFIVASLVPLFLPNAYLNKLQFSKRPRVYKSMGVDIINKLAQNGALINKLVRRKYPGYKGVEHSGASIKKLIGLSYMYEKFHWFMFIFFSLVIVYALYHRHIAWAIIVFLTNLFYNVYPNLLQQYIRLRLSSYTGKQ